MPSSSRKENPPPPREIVLEPALARYVEDWGRETDCGYLAEDSNETPIGAAWLRLFQGDQKGYGYVDDVAPELSIAILPGHRG